MKRLVADLAVRKPVANELVDLAFARRERARRDRSIAVVSTPAASDAESRSPARASTKIVRSRHRRVRSASRRSALPRYAATRGRRRQHRTRRRSSRSTVSSPIACPLAHGADRLDRGDKNSRLDCLVSPAALARQRLRLSKAPQRRERQAARRKDLSSHRSEGIRQIRRLDRACLGSTSLLHEDSHATGKGVL